MHFSLRPFTGDFTALAALLNTVNTEPLTPEQLEANHTAFPANGLRSRTVAVNESGALLGYANTSWRPGAQPGRFFFTLVTAPGARRKGIGSALLADLAAWVRSQGGSILMTGVEDDDERAAQFARRHNFTVEEHQVTSALRLPQFDPSRFAGVLEQAEASGIRFVRYADLPGDESTERNVYELYKVTDLDTPGYAGTDPDDYPSFERWREGIFGDEKTLPEGLFIAVDGDRFVGMTLLQREDDEGGLYTEYTGVLREYRGRRLGLALKLLSVQFAREYGASFMTTKNEASNGPMLAINQQMGYVKTSGRYWLVKNL
ncbi:MAG: GNAT family N-acetyltransferase [Bacillota bacterium]